ncbi:MAG: thioredoxin family protein [Candidatus Kapaibacterium sp.]|jgi:small redox-active disulfide protein 2|nr:thioredoxin family protein [Candidatus Kapabacteria bacterium]
MYNIKILGTGCSKCLKLEENVRRAISEMSIEAEVFKVTDLNDIMAYGVLMPPGLVINEKVVSFGKLLNSKDVAKLITEFKI